MGRQVNNSHNSQCHIQNKQRRLHAIHNRNRTNPTTTNINPVIKSSPKKSNSNSNRSGGGGGWWKQKGQGRLFRSNNTNNSNSHIGPATCTQYALQLQRQQRSQLRRNAQKGAGLLMVGLVIILQNPQTPNPVENQQNLAHLVNPSVRNHNDRLTPTFSRDFFGKAWSDMSNRGGSSSSSSNSIGRSTHRSSIPINMRRVNVDMTTAAITSNSNNPSTTTGAVVLVVGGDLRGGAMKVTHATTRFASQVAKVLVGTEGVQQVARAASYTLVIVPVRLALNVTTSLAITGFQALRPWLPDGILTTVSTTTKDGTLTTSIFPHSQAFGLWTAAAEHSHRVLETIAAKAASFVSPPSENETNNPDRLPKIQSMPYPKQKKDRFLTWVRRIQGASPTEQYFHTSTNARVTENK